MVAARGALCLPRLILVRAQRAGRAVFDVRVLVGPRRARSARVTLSVVIARWAPGPLVAVVADAKVTRAPTDAVVRATPRLVANLVGFVRRVGCFHAPAVVPAAFRVVVAVAASKITVVHEYLDLRKVTLHRSDARARGKYVFSLGRGRDHRGHVREQLTDVSHGVVSPFRAQNVCKVPGHALCLRHAQGLAMAEGLHVGVTADRLVGAHLIEFERFAHSDYAGVHFLEPWPCRRAPFLAPRVNTLGVLGGEHLAVLVQFV